MFALLERNAREVGLSHNFGEDWVREDRQELVGIEQHWSIANDMYLSGRGCLFVDRFLEKNRTGSVGTKVTEEKVRVASPGSLMGRGGAVSGAGRVRCLLITDKLRCFHW